MLYVPLRNQHLIRTTLPTSWGFIPAANSPPTMRSVMPDGDTPKTPFELLFQFVSTTDDAAYLCIPAAIKFRQEVCGGEERIFSYLDELANQAGDAVAAALDTEVLQEPDLQPGEVSQIRRCAMVTVRLPLAVQSADSKSSSTSTKKTPYPSLTAEAAPDAVAWIQRTLADKYGTFLPIFRHGDWLWTRLSAQVYLEKSDFEWAAGILKELCEKVGTGEFNISKEKL